MENVIAIVMGLAFGYSLYWVGASSPKKLIAMLRLQDLTLMKIIVFAIGIASVLLFTFGLLGWLTISHLSVKSTNLAVIIGGLLFGIGFGTVGTCPGTCVAAAGSGGAKKAVSAVAGGLIGAWLFSMTYQFWMNVGLYDIMDFGKLTLFAVSDKYPSVFTMGFTGLFAVGVIFMLIGCFLPAGKIHK